MQSLLHELENIATMKCNYLEWQSTATPVENLVYHSWTSHIEIDICFIKNKVARKELKVRFVPTINQIVDVLTKSISQTNLKY